MLADVSADLLGNNLLVSLHTLLASTRVDVCHVDECGAVSSTTPTSNASRTTFAALMPLPACAALRFGGSLLFFFSLCLDRFCGELVGGEPLKPPLSEGSLILQIQALATVHVSPSDKQCQERE
eukprot:m.210533 g.210533  ORF g.210533 m.210533 type:complete len:124 (+) comp15052_c0_seq1:4542-4913(+)